MQTTRTTAAAPQDESRQQQRGTTLTMAPEEQNTNHNNTRSRKKQYAVSTQWEQQQQHTPTQDCPTRLCCWFATPVGHMQVLMERSDGSPLFMAGPCWPFCLGVTVPLILGISGAVSYCLIYTNQVADLPNWLLFVYIPVVLIVLGFLCCVSCRDPGLLERVTDEEAGQGGWFWNEQVGSYRPPGALYCRECGVLIQEYDHLCPWTGTGIGKRNMWAFKGFVISVNILCYFSIGLLIWALLQGITL